ncbi:putative protein TPRXL [Rhagoletis pomonella]|uniref:putative protein TPRXL n=1 Tax=Rhagoletis pomonella TaxID=28610 RepID=UPI0017870BD0|nr:putative protein TPRXL [Rhagoletis pomonella]
MNAEEDKQKAIGEETSSINEDSPSASNNASTHSASNNQQTYEQQQQPLQSLQSTRTTNPDMKRSAVKELIERYFYQLQRGCGNPKCSNENCASSGQVAPMNPNEIAARAIQLFSQDAKLCDYSQPPKVPRTQNDSPSSSHSASSAATTPSIQDSDMPSPNDSSTSSTSSSTSTSSSSGNSTITSGSASGSVHSHASQHSNISSSGPNSAGGGGGTGGGGGGDADVAATSSSSLISHSRPNSNRSLENTRDRSAAAADMCQLEILCNAAEAAEMAVDNSNLQTAQTGIPVEGGPAARTASGPPTPTFAPVPYLNEALLDELLDECVKFNTYDRLLHAINEVYPHVERLSKSFRRPVFAGVHSTQLTSSATASKLQELLGFST